MHNETNMQDLFPAPNPFRMEQDPIACYRRDKHLDKDKKTPDNRRFSRRLHPNAVVSLVLVLLLALAFMVSAINANLASGTGDARWATDNAAIDSSEDDIVRNVSAPSQPDQG